MCAHKVMLSVKLVSFFFKEFHTLHWVSIDKSTVYKSVNCLPIGITIDANVMHISYRIQQNLCGVDYSLLVIWNWW